MTLLVAPGRRTRQRGAIDLRTLLVTLIISTLLFSAVGIFFLPRVVMLIAQRKLASVEQVTDEGKAPVNQVSHTHRLVTADDRVIVRRATGPGAGTYAIAGPGWQGTLPPNVKRIDAPTNTVWLIGRTMVHGPADIPEVTALQAQITRAPLSRLAR
jgi:hypothetical protein